MVYILIVTFTAKDEESIQAVLKQMETLIAYSQEKESGTLSYEIVRPEEVAEGAKPSFTLVERYVNKAALDDVHLKSDHFAAIFKYFGEQTEPLGLTLKMERFGQPAAAAKPMTSVEDRPEGVLVFCGSREGNDPIYKEKAAELGKLMAEQKKPLVYGGGTVGLMGAIAKACHSNGGDVTGIIPRALIPREAIEAAPYTPIYVDTMAVRKSKMFELSGTVISMPGGIGTFDELLEVLTLFQLNAYRPKIGLLNVKGFYDPFLVNLDKWIEAGFVNADAKDYMVISADPAELLKGLDAHVPPPSVKKLEWTAKP